MLVTLKEVLDFAEKKDSAIGAFNVCNLESAEAVIGAAEETGSPVILNYAEVHSPYMTMDLAAPVMLYYAKKASVPVVVHLDHGASFESCAKAVRLGFTSVMIDASALSYEDNIRVTKEVVKLSHAVGVTVEAELGHILVSDTGVGDSPEKIETADTIDTASAYTDPDLAREFADETKVDALAVAFGTTHGIYTVKPKLDLERVKMIREKLPLPLVMHGGSGLSPEEFRTAIKNGIRKVNYYTYMTLAGGKAVKKALDKCSPEDNIFFHDIPVLAVEAMKENVKEAIEVFSMR